MKQLMSEKQISDDRKENVLIRAGDCALTVIPHLGGKIASLKVNDHELLQTPLAPLAPRTPTLPFDESDASGWDECLPSVAACTVETANGTAQVPDHGDLWRVAWESVNGSLQDRQANTITLRGDCFSLPLSLERSIALKETPSGWSLDVDYMLTNTSASPVPWTWAAHILFASEAGDRIVLPPSVSKLRLEGSGGNRLGKGGDQVSWPIAKLADGTSTDLSLAQAADSGIGDKLFAGPMDQASDDQENSSWCMLERPSAGVSIRVEFDAAATPYIGLWICYGGWPDRPGPKQTCVALEPSTSLVDSLSHFGTWSRSIGAGETITWPMRIQIEHL